MSQNEASKCGKTVSIPQQCSHRGEGFLFKLNMQFFMLVGHITEWGIKMSEIAPAHLVEGFSWNWICSYVSWTWGIKMWGNCQNTPTVLTLRWRISLQTEYAVLYVSWTCHRMRHDLDLVSSDGCSVFCGALDTSLPDFTVGFGPSVDLGCSANCFPSGFDCWSFSFVDFKTSFLFFVAVLDTDCLPGEILPAWEGGGLGPPVNLLFWEEDFESTSLSGACSEDFIIWTGTISRIFPTIWSNSGPVHLSCTPSSLEKSMYSNCVKDRLMGPAGGQDIDSNNSGIIGLLRASARLTSRRQFTDRVYLVVKQVTTTLQPRTPRSILSNRESPPPIWWMSIQHEKPSSRSRRYSFITCFCLPHWYEMKTSGETPSAYKETRKCFI